MPSEYYPDKWEVLKIFSPEYGVLYRLFGSWYGGFTDRDHWKLNSGITEVVEQDNSYLVYGETGSVYICNKSARGIAGLYNNSILNNMLKVINIKEGHSAEIVDISTVPRKI